MQTVGEPVSSRCRESSMMASTSMLFLNLEEALSERGLVVLAALVLTADFMRVSVGHLRLRRRSPDAAH